MSRLAELIEGDNNKFSMRVICTYIVTLTLCTGVFMSLKNDDGGTAIGLAGILSTLMGIIYGIGKFVDGSVTKAGMPSHPSVTVDNVENVNVSGGKNASQIDNVRVSGPNGGRTRMESGGLERKGKPTPGRKKRPF